jgi:ribonuclease HI
MTNNEAEAYALFEGIRLAQSMGIQSLIICGDSMMVIRVIIKGYIVGGNVYSGVMSQSLALLKNFDECSLYHIKRDLNFEADKRAKEGSRLGIGEIIINGEKRLSYTLKPMESAFNSI